LWWGGATPQNKPPPNPPPPPTPQLEGNNRPREKKRGLQGTSARNFSEIDVSPGLWRKVSGGGGVPTGKERSSFKRKKRSTRKVLCARGGEKGKAGSLQWKCLKFCGKKEAGGRERRIKKGAFSSKKGAAHSKQPPPWSEFTREKGTGKHSQRRWTKKRKAIRLGEGGSCCV